MIDKIIYTVIKPSSEEDTAIVDNILEDMGVGHKKGDQSIIVDSIMKEDIDQLFERCDAKGIVSLPVHLVYYENNKLNCGVLTETGFANEWSFV